jgi:catechol 1,2-dioxygenase
MANVTRRSFVQRGMGLCAGGILLGDVQPTLASGDLGRYAQYVSGGVTGQVADAPAAALRLTEDNILGPFHRERAPFRAKVTPPMAPGDVLVISGRVFGIDTRRPLVNATIDIWQANANGRYDNDDPSRPPAADVFLYRARVLTDENGYYEYETIKPAPYQIGENQWRPSHIHYLVRHPRYRQLITQLYFRGDEHQRTDAWIKESLIIDLRRQTANNHAFRAGVFDIVLAPM